MGIIILLQSFISIGSSRILPSETCRLFEQKLFRENEKEKPRSARDHHV